MMLRKRSEGFTGPQILEAVRLLRQTNDGLMRTLDAHEKRLRQLEQQSPRRFDDSAIAALLENEVKPIPKGGK